VLHFLVLNTSIQSLALMTLATFHLSAVHDVSPRSVAERRSRGVGVANLRIAPREKRLKTSEDQTDAWCGAS
jgi:hypothetical protein